jgi:c-di-GMP-binding flagellar brake protein YcgR
MSCLVANYQTGKHIMSRQGITTASEANRRRARRTAVSGHVKVQCRKGRLGLGPDVAFKILDLSETGASLIVKAAVREGEDIELVFCSPGFPRPLSCPAEVVWSVALADGSHGIGVNFTKHLSTAQRQRLAKL